MHLSGLVVYPVKSCAGIAVQRWPLDDRGLLWDRSFMVVDAATGLAVTQRESPRLALVRPEFRGDRLVLQTGSGRVEVAGSGDLAEASVWEHTGPVADCGDGPAEMLSEHLCRNVRLVGLAPDHARTADQSYAGRGVAVGFSDGFPLLLVGEASLEALNDRLALPLPMNRFRPNIVVSGATAFAEDGWRRVVIGDVPIDIVKPCTRCSITTVDQATGRRAGSEPLRALGTFRRADRGVLFGQNAVHRGGGALVVGSPVAVHA